MRLILFSYSTIWSKKYKKNKWRNYQIKRFCMILNSIAEKVNADIFDVSKNNN